MALVRVYNACDAAECILPLFTGHTFTIIKFRIVILQVFNQRFFTLSYDKGHDFRGILGSDVSACRLLLGHCAHEEVVRLLILKLIGASCSAEHLLLHSLSISHHLLCSCLNLLSPLYLLALTAHNAPLFNSIYEITMMIILLSFESYVPDVTLFASKSKERFASLTIKGKKAVVVFDARFNGLVN